MSITDPSNQDRRAAILRLMLAEAAQARRRRRITRHLSVAAMLALCSGLALGLWNLPKVAIHPVAVNSPIEIIEPVSLTSPNTTPATFPRLSLVCPLVDPLLPTSVVTISTGVGARAPSLVGPSDVSLVRFIGDDELLEVLRLGGQCASIIRTARATTLVRRDCSTISTTNIR